MDTPYLIVSQHGPWRDCLGRVMFFHSENAAQELATILNQNSCDLTEYSVALSRRYQAGKKGCQHESC
jgi:hypothetical protein